MKLRLSFGAAAVADKVPVVRGGGAAVVVDDAFASLNLGCCRCW